MHYGMWRRYGDPQHKPPRLTGQPCSIEGCGKPTVGRGLCSTHWARWRKHGDPTYERTTHQVCVVAGCESKPRSRTAELCDTHYCRLRRTGTLEERELLGRYEDARGYIQIKRPDSPMADARGYAYEHRLVCAEAMGRLLEPDEHVHHIDGNRGNNSPANLVAVKSTEHQTIHALVDRGVDPHVAVERVLAQR